MAMISVDRSVGRPQDYASDGTDAVGFLQFWGNSPALDLVGDDVQAAAFGPAAIGTSPGGVYDKKQEQPEDPFEGMEAESPEVAGELPEPRLPEGTDEPVNILITGGADIRHVLKTVSRRRRHGRKLRFFLHESHHEVLARSVLSLQLLNNTSMNVRERMETFLSLYGNTLVREKDSLYLSEIAKEFVEMVADDSEHPLTKILDLSHLKFKDRDILADVFKGWDKNVPFDIEALRDQRCRGYYRERYDCRKNLMDWDYTTYIKQCAGIIHWYHYKEFCFSGVAYETRLASYNTPNRSLASYTEAKSSSGGLCQVRGFWGDIINTPYHGFGTTADPEDKGRLWKISSGMYKHHETDIAEFNVTAYLSEMDSGTPFHLPPEKPEEHVYPYESPLEELRAADSRIEEVSEDPEKTPEDAETTQKSRGRRGRKEKKKTDWPPLSPGFEDVEVVLLTGGLNELLRKPKYSKLFHRAFVGAMGCMPLFEELGLSSGSKDDPFRCEPDEIKRILRPPRLEKPELCGQRADRCSLAAALAPGAVVTFESMKYQAHFEAMARLSLRHRLAQVGHLAGWKVVDEKRAVPQIEHDMKDTRARELDKHATDFVRFVVPP